MLLEVDGMGSSSITVRRRCSNRVWRQKPLCYTDGSIDVSVLGTVNIWRGRVGLADRCSKCRYTRESTDEGRAKRAEFFFLIDGVFDNLAGILADICFWQSA